jgi:hypothetical protein
MSVNESLLRIGIALPRRTVVGDRLVACLGDSAMASDPAIPEPLVLACQISFRHAALAGPLTFRTELKGKSSVITRLR